MNLIIDTADIDEIKRLKDLLTIDGVTTNPSIICKTKKEPLKVINEIIDILDDDQMLFVQVVSTTYEGIIEESRFLNTLRKKNMYVKIPVSTEGLRAIKAVRKEGIKVLATAIYSAEEAFLAAKSGAEFLAPYVNRMDNYGNGVQDVIDLQKMLNNYGMSENTGIIAASFKNVSQVHQLLTAGISGFTLPVDVINNMVNHPGTKIAVDQFTADWKKTYNREKLV
jgi:TalC/MipB family fructose-6-phosphate aldolase